MGGGMGNKERIHGGVPEGKTQVQILSPLIGNLPLVSLCFSFPSHKTQG